MQLVVKNLSEGIVSNERFEAEKLVFAEGEIFCREPNDNFRWKIIMTNLIQYPSAPTALFPRPSWLGHLAD